MAKLTARDLAGLALGAGIPSGAVETAVAIALAESGGDTDARGDVGIQNATWGPSIGLWQIRSLKAETGKGTARDANALTDAAFNARAMAQISGGGTNWRPWSVYTSRSYLLYLPAAKVGVAANGGVARTSSPTGPGAAAGNPLIPDAIEGTGAAIGQLAAFPTKVTAWVSDRNNIVRVVKVLVGAGLVVIGLYVVSRPVQKQAQDVAKALVGAASTARGGGKGAGKAAPKAPAPAAA